MFGLGIKLVFVGGWFFMGWRPDEKGSEGLYVGEMSCDLVCCFLSFMFLLMPYPYGILVPRVLIH